MASKSAESIISLDFIPHCEVPRSVFETYSIACTSAYIEMFKALSQLIDRTPERFTLDFATGITFVPLDEAWKVSDTAKQTIRDEGVRIIGRCGARIAAALKQAQRTLAITALMQARDSGVDVTPAVAHKIARQVFGRGLDKVVLNGVFGIKGRTAANKSRAFSDPEQSAALEECTLRLTAMNSRFLENAEVIRFHHKNHWVEMWNATRS